MDGLALERISKNFRGKQAVDNVSLAVQAGEILAVVGPSGSGKSTLLNITAGLETPDSGDVTWNGVSLLNTPPHRRDFGLMFQDFALFPHLNVFDNIAFGLRMDRVAPVETGNTVTQMLTLVGLSGFEKRDVNTLSGGEQQRVALARALAPRPRLLMLDEPLGSLDRNLRERLVLDLRRILKQVNQTALYVTHDLEEAFSIADRVAVMNAGRLEQVDTPEELYRRPDSLFVARFLGFSNLLPGEVTLQGDQVAVTTPIGTWPLDTARRGPVTVLFRPDLFRPAADGDNGGAAHLEGRLLQKAFRGSTCRIEVEVKVATLIFDLPSTLELPAVGQPLTLVFEPKEALQILDRED